VSAFLPDSHFLGTSGAFVAAVAKIRRYAASSAPVLMLGETGTGKELAARSIHYWSDRRRGPFVPVNCGAIPDTLIESELFGHVRGAFTDARERHTGLIEQARGGTLFLDEIESLSPRGQVALLRFLQDQEYRPVGGKLAHRADVRVVGATNVELGALAARGAFRHDLVFRLRVLEVLLPPLRARGDDVVLLAEAFLQRLSQRYQRPPIALDPVAIEYLRAHAWPGNVRELENLLHREILLAEGPFLLLRSITGSAATETDDEARKTTLTDRSFRAAKALAVEQFERSYLAELLLRTHGNVSLAARVAGKERSRLGRLMRKYGITGDAFRARSSSPSA